MKGRGRSPMFSSKHTAPSPATPGIQCSIEKQIKGGPETLKIVHWSFDNDYRLQNFLRKKNNQIWHVEITGPTSKYYFGQPEGNRYLIHFFFRWRMIWQGNAPATSHPPIRSSRYSCRTISIAQYVSLWWSFLNGPEWKRGMPWQDTK